MKNDEERRTRDEVLEHLGVTAKAGGAAGRRFVPGVGSSLARLMIVGEAPGAAEAAQGRPFVGRSGQLLNQVLAEAGIRREDIWVTNVVKWRPTTERAGRVVNRPPTAAEVRDGEALLRREMAIIRPRLVLCLGAVAARAVLGQDIKLSDERGRWHDTPAGLWVMVTYHPAYVLRQRAAAGDRVFAAFHRDVMAVGQARHGLPADQ